jgi:serine/threonine-protein kinase RsbW
MSTIPNVRLRLPNRAENVPLVRQMLSGLAEAIELDPLELNDINTAVSEACNNVVLHAYAGQEGPLEVDVYIAPSALEIVVRDHGGGIPPRTQQASEPADGGIGLPVIQALAHRVEIRSPGGGGTELRMEFTTPHTAAIEPIAETDGGEPADLPSCELADTTAMAIAPTPLARSILPRVLCSLAARANLSTDRISDAHLLADALLANLDGSVGERRLGFEIGVAPRELELRVGPLRSGSAHALLEECALDGLGPLIERLTDGHRVANAGADELLALRLVERRQPPRPVADTGGVRGG